MSSAFDRFIKPGRGSRHLPSHISIHAYSNTSLCVDDNLVLRLIEERLLSNLSFLLTDGFNHQTFGLRSRLYVSSISALSNTNKQLRIIPAKIFNFIPISLVCNKIQPRPSLTCFAIAFVEIKDSQRLVQEEYGALEEKCHPQEACHRNGAARQCAPREDSSNRFELWGKDPLEEIPQSQGEEGASTCSLGSLLEHSTAG
jgi:hypothetical protein